MLLIYHVTSRNHVFNRLRDLISLSFLRQVTISPSLVAIGLLVVVIQQLKYFM